MSTDDVIFNKRNKLKDKYKSWYCLDAYNSPPKCYKTVQVQQFKKNKSVSTVISNNNLLNKKQDSQIICFLKAIFNIFVFFCTATTIVYRPLVYLIKILMLGRSSLKRFVETKF